VNPPSSAPRISAYALGKGKGVFDNFGRYIIQERDWTTDPEQMGEDSLFMTPLVHLNDAYFMGFGVADGVGGWSQVPGGHPELISRGLMKHAEEIFAEYLGHIHKTPFHPAYICPIVTAQAVERLTNRPPGKGATTSVIAVSLFVQSNLKMINHSSHPIKITVFRSPSFRETISCLSLLFCW
jgi:hypothetical protein